MKITAVWGLICLFLLFSCKKDTVAPDTTPAPPTTTATSNTSTSNSAGTSNTGSTNTTTTTGGTNTTTAGGNNTSTATSGPAAANTGTSTTKTGTTTGGATGATTTGNTSTTTGTPTTTKPGTTTPTTTTPTPTTTTPTPGLTPSTLAGVYGDGTHDDTQALQALLNAGNVTLAAGKTYKISSLRVPHSFNLNGSTLMVSGSSYAAGIMLTATGAGVTNGSIKGTWSATSPGNANGVTGMYIVANNCSISHINLSSFAAYGILVGPYNNPSVTYCNIQSIGYIAFYFDAETAITSGGVLSNNTIDRSMLPASTVSELAVGIRGSTSNSSVITSNWTVSGNTIKMPYLPTDWTAECIEIRNCANIALSNNTLVAGSIGISVVRSSGITVSGNSFSNNQLEAIEFGDSKSCLSQANIINGTNDVGIQIDGTYGSSDITILNNIISNTKNECIHAYVKTQNLTISGCKMTAPSGAKAVNLQQTNNVIIQNNTFIGNSVASLAVMLDTCPGNVTISGGTVSNFKSCVVAIYSAKSGLITNNVTMSGVTVTGVPRALNTILSNGASVGSNIVVTL